MLSAIRQFFDENLKPGADDDEAGACCKVQLATAALLFELLKTDSHIDDRETAAVKRVLEETFGLDKQTISEIVALAEDEAQQATSLYEFTSLINSDYDYQQKVALIGNMWRVALADQVLDKYEENLIRRTADLIYVSHSDFIRSKLEARDEADRKQSGNRV